MFLSVDLLIDNFNLESAGDFQSHAKVADADAVLVVECRLVLFEEQLVLIFEFFGLGGSLWITMQKGAKLIYILH